MFQGAKFLIAVAKPMTTGIKIVQFFESIFYQIKKLHRNPMKLFVIAL